MHLHNSQKELQTLHLRYQFASEQPVVLTSNLVMMTNSCNISNFSGQVRMISRSVHCMIQMRVLPSSPESTYSLYSAMNFKGLRESTHLLWPHFRRSCASRACSILAWIPQSAASTDPMKKWTNCFMRRIWRSNGSDLKSKAWRSKYCRQLIWRAWHQELSKGWWQFMLWASYKEANVLKSRIQCE